MLRKPEKLFGYSYLYMMVILAALGYSYVSKMTVIGKNSAQPMVFQDSSALDIPFESPAVLPPVDVMKVSVPTPELVNKGRELFRGNCASCHGDEGKGDGPAGLLMSPRPRNFHIAAGWTNGSKISQIYKTLQEGITRNGMASYGYIRPEDRFALIHYIRTLNSANPLDSPEELRGLDASYQLSKGMSVAGQIPIKKATQIVLGESRADAARIESELKSVNEAAGKGAEIFKRVAGDEKRALTSLMNGSRVISDLPGFVKIVSADPIHLGFKANVVQLSADEWKLMYQYVLTLFNQKEE